MFPNNKLSFSFKVFGAVTIVLTSALFSTGTIAQTHYLFQGYEGLTKVDIALIKKTARIDMADKDEGTILPWANAKSGNKGQVKLARRYIDEGRECRVILHNITFKDGSNKKINFTICHYDDRWHVVK